MSPKRVLQPVALAVALTVLLGVIGAGGLLLGGSKTRALFSSSAEALAGNAVVAAPIDAGRPDAGSASDVRAAPFLGGTKSGLVPRAP